MLLSDVMNAQVLLYRGIYHLPKGKGKATIICATSIITPVRQISFTIMGVTPLDSPCKRYCMPSIFRTDRSDRSYTATNCDLMSSDASLFSAHFLHLILVNNMFEFIYLLQLYISVD